MDQAIDAINIIGSKIVFIVQIISVVLILINLLRQIIFNFSKEFIITEILKSAFIIIIIFSMPKIFDLIARIFDTF